MAPVLLSFGGGMQTGYGYHGYNAGNIGMTGDLVDDTPSTSGKTSLGRLWRIETKAGTQQVQALEHGYDAVGNVTAISDFTVATPGQGANLNGGQVLAYDDLDRLTSVTAKAGLPNGYNQSFTYNQIGNLMSVTREGVATSYSYGGSKPHAVTAAGSKSYQYDANGNMTSGDGRVLSWDVENRSTQAVKDGVTTSFVYDGDGKRVLKTAGGQTTVYIGGIYERNLSTNEETRYYSIAGKRVALRKNAALSYIMSDHLGGTWGIYDPSRPLDANNPAHSFYFAYGESRPSTQTVPTDRLFTGQRLDASTGLYDYGARLYDPWLGRFISADTVVPDPAKPQALNRYSYTANNPIKYTDPSGHAFTPDTVLDAITVVADLNVIRVEGPTEENVRALLVDTMLAVLPFVPAPGLLRHAAKAVPGGGSSTTEAVTRAKTGPKLKLEGVHNEKIAQIEAEMKEELGSKYDHIAGGSLPEQLEDTSGGLKNGRRGDLVFREANGESKIIAQAGRTTKDRHGHEYPVRRERESMDDIATRAHNVIEVRFYSTNSTYKTSRSTVRHRAE